MLLREILVHGLFAMIPIICWAIDIVRLVHCLQHWESKAMLTVVLILRA